MDYNKNNSNNDRNSYNFIIFTKKTPHFCSVSFLCVSWPQQRKNNTKDPTSLDSIPTENKKFGPTTVLQPARTSLHSHSRLATGFLDEVFKPLSSFCFVLFFRFSVSVSFHVLRLFAWVSSQKRKQFRNGVLRQTDRRTGRRTNVTTSHPTSGRTLILKFETGFNFGRDLLFDFQFLLLLVGWMFFGVRPSVCLSRSAYLYVFLSCAPHLLQIRVWLKRSHRIGSVRISGDAKMLWRKHVCVSSSDQLMWVVEKIGVSRTGIVCYRGSQRSLSADYSLPQISACILPSI